MADEIGRAMQKVGGTAGALNVNFEKVSSWIAVISSRTRESAETIGQSVKSILARVQSLKETGFDEEDGTKINQVAKALNEVGVQLTDSQGQFRNFGTVMDELGARWKDLDSRQKAYIATTVAGTYQQSRFLNLMEGYGDSVNLYTKALDSAGTASKKFELYQQGTQAQLDKLKASLESVWMGMFNSEGINAVITSLNGLTSGFKAIIDSVGALAPVFAIAGTAILAFNGGLKSIMANGTATIAVLRGIPSGLTSLDTALAASTLRQRLFASATTATTATMNGLKIALGSTMTFLAGAVFPMAAFAAVGFTIQKVTEAIAKHNEELRKMKQEQDDIVQKYSAHSDKIDQLAKEYEYLTNQVKNNQLDKNSELYVNNMNELGKLMPSLVQSTNEHGDSILRSVDAVKQELDYAKQLKENYAQLAVTNFEKDLDKQATKVEDILSKIEKYKKNATGADQSPLIQDKVGRLPVDKETKLFDERQIIAQERELQLLLADSGKYMNEKAKAIMEVEGLNSKLSDSSKKIVESYINEAVASKKTIKDGEDFKQFLSDTTNKAVDFADKLSKIPEALVGVFSTKQVNKLSKDQIQALNSISDNLENGGSGWEHYKETLLNAGFTSKQADSILKELTKSTKDNADAAVDDTIKQQELAKAIEDAGKKYDDSVSKIEDLSKALYELDTNQGLTTDTIGMIAEKYPELLAYINDEKTLREQLTSTIDNEKNTALDAMVTKLSSNEKFFADAKKENVDYFNDIAKLYEIDLKNTTTLAQLKFQVESKLKEKLSKTWASYYDQQTMAFTTEGKKKLASMGYQEAANSKELATILDYERTMKSISATMRSFTADSSYSAGITNAQTKALESVSKATDKANKSTENSIYISDKYQQALENLNLEIEKLHKLQSQYPDTSSQYQSALKKEISLLDQKKKLLQEQSKSLSAQIASGKIIQTGQVVSASSTSSVASGNSTAAQIWNYFKSKGFTDSVVAGIMGNMQLESGLNTSALNKSSGAYGLVQWLGGRKSGLSSFAASRGTSMSDLGTQLDYLWKELNGSEKKTLNYLLSNQNASASTVAAMFDKLFERSEGTSVASRQKYANQFLSQYSGGKAGSASVSDVSKDMATNAQNIDEAKSQLLQLQQDILDIDSQIQELNMSLINSVTAEQDRKIDSYKDDMAMLDFLQSRNSELSESWRSLEKERARELEKQREYQEQAIAYLNEQYRLNTLLTSAQKAQIAAEVDSRTEAMTQLQQAINDSYKKIRESQVNSNIESINKLYDDEIAKLNDKLKLLDEVEKSEDRIKTLKEKQDAIDKAKSDKRFEYINSNGQVELTYDKGVVSDLEKEMSDLQDQYAKEDQRKSLEDQIAELEKKRDTSIDDMNKLLETYAYKAYSNTQQLQDIMKQFVVDLGNIYNVAIDIPKHHSGGIVGTAPTPFAKLVNKIFNVKPNEEVAKLLKGEVVINPNLPNVQNNFMKMFSGLSALKPSQQTQQVLKQYHLNNVTIKADNPMELFAGLNNLILSE